MEKSVLVSLSPMEIGAAVVIAAERLATKRDRRSHHNKVYSAFAVHYAGVVGEMAFRKVFGGKMNTAVLPGGDKHEPDVILPDGRRVEVKSSLYQGRDCTLKLTAEELEHVEHVCLVRVTLPDQGEVFPIWSRKEVLERAKVRDYGYGDRFVVSCDQEGVQQ